MVINTSKFVAKVLRHEPSIIGASLDEHAYIPVDQLIDGVRSCGPDPAFDLQKLQHIVDVDDKGRFSFSDDGTKIRANNAHTKVVDPGFERKVPPDVLYHGTASGFVSKIRMEGINKMKRTHVNLTPNIDTAQDVGARHTRRFGYPVILKIDAKKMHEDGVEFFVTTNGVWLVDHVDPCYFEVI